MSYLNFLCPPLPHFVLGGTARYRAGDLHEKRTLTNVFDLIFVRSGKLYLEENRQHHEVEQGQYIILLPDMIHKGDQCCDGDTFFSWIHFHTCGEYTITQTPQALGRRRLNRNQLFKKEEFMLSIAQTGSIDPIDLPNMEKYLNYVSLFEVNRYQNITRPIRSTVSQLELEQVFLRILSMLCKAGQGLEEHPVLADNIWEYLNENYDRPFDLDLLAKIFAFHPGHIIRSVKNKYGVSPLQLQMNIRMEKAKQLLKNTNHTVAKIGEDVGFQNPAYFSRQFKKITGMTPREYRNFRPEKDIGEAGDL